MVVRFVVVVVVAPGSFEITGNRRREEWLWIPGLVAAGCFWRVRHALVRVYRWKFVTEIIFQRVLEVHGHARSKIVAE